MYSRSGTAPQRESTNHERDQLIMALDWGSDHFVRLYTRETDDDLLLSWEARAVWHELLKKFDKQGKLTTKRGLRGLAALIRVPLEVVDRAVPELVDDGRLRQDGNTFFAPNYTHANYTPRASGARMAQSRIRAGLHGAGGTSGVASEESTTGDVSSHGASDISQLPDEHVTECDAALRPVTAVAHIRSEQIRSEAVHSARARGRGGSRVSIPPDWKPRERERQLAQELGLDCDAEAKEFLVFWLGDGRAKADWDQIFNSRLLAQGKRKPSKQQEERNVDEL